MENYKSQLYAEVLETAKEIIVTNEFDHLDHDPYCEGKFSHPTIQEYFGEMSDLEIIELGQQYLAEDLQKNKYKTENSRNCDLEWLEAFKEWRDIYNERLVA